jgi:hypothetical protein
VQIATPHERNAGIGFSSVINSVQHVKCQRVMLYPEGPCVWNPPTVIQFTPDSNDEEEAFWQGLFDVLDDWSRYSITLIAIPPALLEEAEDVAAWEPQGNVDYLGTP